MGTRKRIGLMVGMVVAVSAAAPTQANAIDLNPFHALDSFNPTKLVGKILDQVFKWIFGYTPGQLAAKVLKAAISTPDLGGDLFGPLREGVHQLRFAAVALLILFFLTGLTYSLATDPSRAGVDVFKRLAVAIVGMIAAPQLFEQFNTFIGYVADAVISTPMVQHSVADGLDAAFGGGQIGAVFAGLAMILLFVLLCAKVVILALLALLYVATPFVMASYVDPRMSHIAGVWIQSTALVQFVPVAWSLILLAFGAIGGMGNLFSGAGLASNFVNIAVALTLLAMLVFSIPVMLRMAWIGGFIPSMRGAGTMAWGGAQVAGAVAGGSADLAQLESNAQDAMTDAAAPPAAQGDSRGGAGGPAMDFGAGGGEDAMGGGFAAAASEPVGLAPSVAPASAGALPAGSTDDIDATASPTEARASSPAGEATGPAGSPDLATAATGDSPTAAAASTGSGVGAAVGAATAGDSAAVDPADVPGGGAGDPLPAPASDVVAATPPATSSTSAPTPAGAADATPLASDDDGGGASATTSSTSSPEEGAVSVPIALDGGDVRAASTAAPIDARDVEAPAPELAPAVTDPEQETPQR
jgi:hypothetical protein